MSVSRDETMVLDAETVARYRSDGAVCIRNAIGREWVEAIEKVRKTHSFIEVSFSRRVLQLPSDGGNRQNSKKVQKIQNCHYHHYCCHSQTLQKAPQSH